MGGTEGEGERLKRGGEKRVVIERWGGKGERGQRSIEWEEVMEGEGRRTREREKVKGVEEKREERAERRVEAENKRI